MTSAFVTLRTSINSASGILHFILSGSWSLHLNILGCVPAEEDAYLLL